MYVCLCRGVTDTQIRQAVASGAHTVKEVNSRLGTASQCGKCALTTKDIVNQEIATMTGQGFELASNNGQFYQAC